MASAAGLTACFLISLRDAVASRSNKKTAPLTTKTSTGGFLSVRALSGSSPLLFMPQKKPPQGQLVFMASAAGLEPTTHSLGNCCSIQMSYADLMFL